MKTIRPQVEIVDAPDGWEVRLVRQFTTSAGLHVEAGTRLGSPFQDKDNARAFCAQINADIVRYDR